jgi:hypothetical protein
MTEKVHDYHEGNRYFHDRFDTRRLADRMAADTSDHIDPPARALMAQADMFFLATYVGTMRKRMGGTGDT